MCVDCRQKHLYADKRLDSMNKKGWTVWTIRQQGHLSQDTNLWRVHLSVLEGLVKWTKKQKITIQSKNNDHSKKRKRKNKEKNHTTIQQPTKIMTTPKNDNLWIMEGLLNWGKTECFGSLVLHSLLITEGNFPEWFSYLDLFYFLLCAEVSSEIFLKRIWNWNFDQLFEKLLTPAQVREVQ